MAPMLDSLWGAAVLIGSFLLVLGAVVFIHEFGHFFVARRCGVKIEVFSIGMGPEVVGRTDKRGARWRLSAIPIGGYVRFAGDRDAASAPDEDALSAMSPAERRETLAGQPVLARAAIVAAGPIANLAMAVLVLSGLAYAYGERYLPPRVDAVVAGSAGRAGGLRARRRDRERQRPADRLVRRHHRHRHPAARRVADLRRRPRRPRNQRSPRRRR